MQFNSVIFIFFFLPIVISVHSILHNTRLRNVWLLATSMLFYGWCNTRGLAIMVVYGVINYFIAKWISHACHQKWRIACGVILDAAVLYVFKYWNFAASLISRLPGLEVPHLDLFQPMGISFVTFTTIAYLTDVYRGKVKPVTNIMDFYLYLFLFPKAAQGPITCYDQLGTSIAQRSISLEEFTNGLRRFVIGLGKKCLIADILGKTVDIVISAVSSGVEPLTVWIAVLMYAFQIFFDFSGYMDMAIGIGKMLGFHLPENFDRPYLSVSVSEFWRRWHMTLGSWFRNYIYIPMGGNRQGTAHTVFNLAVVWILTGIWHGAAGHFILWGVYFGCFVITEKFIKDKMWYQKIPKLVKWGATFLIVMFGWVIFRADSISQAMTIFKTMFGFPAADICIYKTAYFFDMQSMVSLILAIILTLPRPNFVKNIAEQAKLVYVAADIGLILIFGFSILYMVNSTYNSFIYFQF